MHTNRILLPAAVLAAGLIAAAPSAAAVTYTFDLGQGAGFTVIAPAFLSTEPANNFGAYDFDLNVAKPYGTMTSCTGFAGTACGTQSILPPGLSFSPRPGNVVVEYRTASVGTLFRYFASSALGTYGVYQDAVLSTGDTLTVASAVPEPTTWTVMLLGFATLGGVLRCRREQPVVTA